MTSPKPTTRRFQLLQNEESVKKNITKTGRYLSKVKLYRFEKTVLGIAVALSFPYVPKQEVANLIGISGTAIRTNLALKKFAGGTIATQVNLVIRKQINIHSIFDYLEIVVSTPKIPQVETKDLRAVADKAQKIETVILSITELLKEKDLFWDEAIILATAICASCPSIKKEVVKRIITSAVGRKVKFHQIELLQRELVTGKTVVKKELLLREQLGELLEERETDVLCAKCGKFVFLQIFPNNKKIFACKHC